MKHNGPESMVQLMRQAESKLNPKTSGPFSELKIAIKRASYFSKDISAKGPFSPIGKTGLSIPVRNALWLLDLKKSLTEKDFKEELIILQWLAKTINKWIDTHLIEGNEEAVWALKAFLSRLWFDVEKL